MDGFVKAGMIWLSTMTRVLNNHREYSWETEKGRISCFSTFQTKKYSVRFDCWVATTAAKKKQVIKHVQPEGEGEGIFGYDKLIGCDIFINLFWQSHSLCRKHWERTRATAQNVSFRNYLWWPMYINNFFEKPNYLIYTKFEDNLWEFALREMETV